MFQHLLIRRTLFRGILVAILPILLSTAVSADPPELLPPEDVLRPESGDYPAFYLMPYLGLNYSFLLSSPVRQVNAESLGELENDVVDGGAGLGFEGGLDLLYRPIELLGVRGGVGFHRRVVGASGTVTSLCELEIPGSGSTTQTEEPVNMSYCIVADYLDIHLGAELYLGDAFFSLGYAFGSPLRVTYQETDEILDTANACVYLPRTDDETKRVSGRVAIDSDLRNARHSIRLGGGYAWEINDRLQWLLRLEYDHPFTDVYTGQADGVLVNEETENSTGYTIPLEDGVSFGTFSLAAALRFRL